MRSPGHPTLVVRAAVAKHYGDLKGHLGLNDVEAAALIALLTVHHFSLMRTTQEHLDDPPALLDAQGALNARLEKGLIALLGAEKYARFAAHREQLSGQVV
jgi:hypothetical protein